MLPICLSRKQQSTIINLTNTIRTKEANRKTHLKDKKRKKEKEGTKVFKNPQKRINNQTPVGTTVRNQ